MSHQPERPQEYVCEGCGSVVVGPVSGSPPDHSYEAPAECAACGGSSFVELEQHPHE